MIYHIPAESRSAAEKIAQAIRDGKVNCPEHYRSADLAAKQARTLAVLHASKAFAVWTVERSAERKDAA